MTKTSTILKKAKKKMSNHLLQGICSAVAFSDVPIGYKLKVQKMICKRILPYAYAHDWLASKMTTAPKGQKAQAMREWIYNQRARDIQAWRHQWLDMMIQEFLDKGD